LRNSDKAATDLNKAAQLDPSDKAIQAEIRFHFTLLSFVWAQLVGVRKAHHHQQQQQLT
jgi:hypothetical protein